MEGIDFGDAIGECSEVPFGYPLTGKDLRATLSRTISRKQYIAFYSIEKRKFAQAVRASPQDGAVHFASYLGSGIFFGHTVRPRSDGRRDRERG